MKKNHSNYAGYRNLVKKSSSTKAYLLISALALTFIAIFLTPFGRKDKVTAASEVLSVPQEMNIVPYIPEDTVIEVDTEIKLPLDEIILPELISQNVLTVPKAIKKISAENGCALKVGQKGTVIHIKPNSLLYEDGSLVKGLVDIQYAEYRDQADIVASNLPMTIKDAGEYKYFNSAGMFELKAEQNGRKILIDQNNPIEIDFPVKDIPNTNYYALNSETNQWEFIEELDERKERNRVVKPRGEVAAVNVGFEVKDEVDQNLPNELNVWHCKGCLKVEILNGDSLLSTLAYAKSKLENPEFKKFKEDHNYPKTLEEAFKDARYVGGRYVSENENINNRTLVGFKQVKGRYKKKPLFKLKFSGRLYPELRSFYGVSFASEDNIDLSKSRYTDMRIAPIDNEIFEVTCKSADGTHERYKIIPVQDVGYRKLSIERNNITMGRYRKSIAKKKKSFDKYNVPAEWIRQENDRMARLYRYALMWMDTTDFVLSEGDWYDEFIDNKDEYLAKVNQIENEFKGLDQKNRKEWMSKCIEQKNQYIQNFDKEELRRHAVKIAFNNVADPFSPAPWRFGNMERTFIDDGNRTGGTLLAENADAGHTYPKIVKGLNVSTFGVYNCDQMYRLSNRVNLQPKYLNEAGNEIQNGSVAVVLDLDFNGSFSFPPSAFTCNAKGRNHILLFTDDKKVFHVDEVEFTRMGVSESGPYTLKMQEVTGEVKTTNDLKELIGLTGS